MVMEQAERTHSGIIDNVPLERGSQNMDWSGRSPVRLPQGILDDIAAVTATEVGI